MSWRNFRLEEQYRGWDIIVKCHDAGQYYEYTLRTDGVWLADQACSPTAEGCLDRAKWHIDIFDKYLAEHPEEVFNDGDE